MTQYRIFPAIGIARVGNSKKKFYVGPESYCALPISPDKDEPIKIEELRDEDHKMSRQAARFQIQLLDEHGRVRPFDREAHKKLIIEWTCHLANKKASWYEFVINEGERGYAPTHKLRNTRIEDEYDRKIEESKHSQPDIPEAKDRHELIIDAGPRTIKGHNEVGERYHFTKATAPKDYQGTHFPDAPLSPTNEPIETLGELRTDAYGRLLVLGGLGISGTTSEEVSLPSYANNNGWWDDTSDGVVSAKVSDDGGQSWIDAGTAHVLVGPPSYAPELPNLVTLWDTIFDGAVRHRNIRPDIFKDGFWNAGENGYKPSFATEIRPLIERAAAYPWVAAIPPKPHQFNMEALGEVPVNSGKGDQYFGLRQFILDVLRAPYQENSIINKRGATMMPYLAGDNCLKPSTLTSSYLRLTDTQYFFLQQWVKGWFVAEAAAPEPGLDITRGVLDNCVGGGFSPGIEMSWICRDAAIYQPADPLRLNSKQVSQGPLSLGYDPAHIEPGDITRYMAMPWQADFNQCASQPIDGRVLWWWPTQRPEFVYLKPLQQNAEESPQEKSGPQVPWIGTGFDQLRGDFICFEDSLDMVKNWSKLGFIIGFPSGDKGPDKGEKHYYEVLRELPRFQENS